jgi:cell division cycle protein 37
MPGFDYSKWDKIDLSDDEETFHPNIDNNLMIRINREQRERREAEEAKQRKKLVKAGDEQGLAALEKKKKLHVNNCSTTVEDRTIVNSAPADVIPRKEIDDFDDKEYHAYIEEHEKLLLEYVHADWPEMRELMRMQGKILTHEHVHAWLLLTCLNKQMAGKTSEMKQFAKAAEVLSQLNELSRTMNKPVLSANVVGRYFDNMLNNEKTQATFQEGVDAFVQRVKERAVVKKKEQEEAAKQEEEWQAKAKEQEALEADPDVKTEKVLLTDAMRNMDKEERLGAGGLDPVEVFESLPPQLQECFASGDIELLQKTAMAMDPAEFQHHFERCKKSGLWNAGGDDVDEVE